MSWKKRGGNRYYYRSVRVGGKSRTIYVGTGIVGATAAAADQLRRIQREQLKEKQHRITADSASVIELSEQMEPLMRAALVAAGFYQHARCQWRKRHHVKQR